MEREGYKRSTSNTHNWQLGQVDKTISGVDEFISKHGIGEFLEWVKHAEAGPFENYPNQARSASRRYVEFLVSEQASESDQDNVEGDVDEELPPTLFKLEKEMQAAVRAQLASLENGLIAVDDGNEVQVATGRIDILAKDANGKLVVIELKVGKCPSGALEQTLGYAEALSMEKSLPVRAILIAGEFPDRIRAAAKRVRDLQLKTYEFKMAFHTPS
jgi:RecB family endonuclease NucS